MDLHLSPAVRDIIITTTTVIVSTNLVTNAVARNNAN
jgi:hypothetical protein